MKQSYPERGKGTCEGRQRAIIRCSSPEPWQNTVVPDGDQVAALFLLTELETGLTFVRIALDNRDYHEKMARNQVNARVAHDTILRFKERIVLTHSQQTDFEAKFATLQAGLRQLGEAV